MVRRIFSSPLTVIGFIFVLILLIFAAFAPVIAPYNPLEVNIANKLQPPSSSIYLGQMRLAGIFSAESSMVQEFP
jgi:peptide/nickel transport system permease protein